MISDYEPFIISCVARSRSNEEVVQTDIESACIDVFRIIEVILGCPAGKIVIIGLKVEGSLETSTYIEDIDTPKHSITALVSRSSILDVGSCWIDRIT